VCRISRLVNVLTGAERHLADTQRDLTVQLGEARSRLRQEINALRTMSEQIRSENSDET
jgi:hypothetical protein